MQLKEVAFHRVRSKDWVQRERSHWVASLLIALIPEDVGDTIVRVEIR